MSTVRLLDEVVSRAGKSQDYPLVDDTQRYGEAYTKLADLVEKVLLLAAPGFSGVADEEPEYERALELVHNGLNDALEAQLGPSVDTDEYSSMSQFILAIPPGSTLVDIEGGGAAVYTPEARDVITKWLAGDADWYAAQMSEVNRSTVNQFAQAYAARKSAPASPVKWTVANEERRSAVFPAVLDDGSFVGWVGVHHEIPPTYHLAVFDSEDAAKKWVRKHELWRGSYAGGERRRSQRHKWRHAAQRTHTSNTQEDPMSVQRLLDEAVRRAGNSAAGWAIVTDPSARYICCSYAEGTGEWLAAPVRVEALVDGSVTGWNPVVFPTQQAAMDWARAALSTHVWWKDNAGTIEAVDADSLRLPQSVLASAAPPPAAEMLHPRYSIRETSRRTRPGCGARA